MNKQNEKIGLCENCGVQTTVKDEIWRYPSIERRDVIAVLQLLLSDLGLLTEGEQCDHGVGICWCGVQSNMHAARVILAREKGDAIKTECSMCEIEKGKE